MSATLTQPVTTRTSAVERPLVSVIVPTHNYGKYIAAAIESVFAQGYDPIEVIVADDGSTDETEQVMRGFGDRVTYLKLGRVGVGRARNAAIEASSGPLLAFLDADDIWLSGKLDAQLEAMQAQPDAGVCHTAFHHFDDEHGDYFTYVIDPPDRFAGLCFQEMFKECGLLTSTSIFRRDTLPPWKFYEDMPITQDYAMFLQAMIDTPTIYLTQPLVRYRKHPDQTTHERRKRWRIYQGLCRLRLVNDMGDRFQTDERTRMREWALNELNDAAYDCYWRQDFTWARVGFRWLHQAGRHVPLKHRIKAGLLGKADPFGRAPTHLSPN